MDNQLKPKSLILQEVVSKNPEKILSDNQTTIRQFLEELAHNIQARQTIMDFVIELGMRRNQKNFVSLREE